jgi:CRP/FNR family transcriptional regulator, cyclic AMP receptor protein
MVKLALAGGTMPKLANPASFDVLGFLTQRGPGRAVEKYHANQVLYSQGDPADSVFYIAKGKVKVTVTSAHGKEAIVAIRGPDEFCGEGAMTGKPRRLPSVTAMTACEAVRIAREPMVLLRSEPEFARVEADLVNQLFSSARCGWHGLFCR